MPKSKTKRELSSFFILPLLLVGLIISVYFIKSNGNLWTMFANEEVSSEIIGGSKVPGGKYPFMASLHDNSWGVNYYLSQICGATLIDQWHVLTAAHCVTGYTDYVGSLDVLIGRANLTGKGGELRKVQKLTLHPQYAPDPNEINEINDAAILLLNEPVTSITPISLSGPDDDFIEDGGHVVIAAGWGGTYPDIEKSKKQIRREKEQKRRDNKNRNNNKKNKREREHKEPYFPKELKEVQLLTVSDLTCDDAYAEDIDFSITICAERKRVDTCYGDSGGPLFYRKPNGSYVQIGIVNGGKGCADPKYPGTYTEINAPAITEFIDEATSSRTSL